LVPEDVPDDARAVGAAAYIYIDHAHGGFGAVVRADLSADDIQLVGVFAIGTGVYIEGLPQETINVDDETGRSRIWWRAVITGPMVRGGST
jgi:hypothetical protein